MAFPGGSAGKESAYNTGDLGSIPGLGRSPGKGKGYPLQYSGLENSMDSIVLGVAKSQTQSVRLSHKYRASRVALATRIHLPRQETLETWVRSLGWEDPLEEGMATHFSLLAWRIPMDRDAWWATVHGVVKSWTGLSD